MIVTYFITACKWLWNAEPRGPGRFFKGSSSGMTRNTFKIQRNPLASRSKTNTAATLATKMMTIGKKAFHAFMVDM